MKHLDRVRKFIYSCRKCGVCGNKVSARVPHVCPVRRASPGFEHFYARGKIAIAQGLLEGALAPSPDLAEAVYSCTLCGNCMTQCGSIDQETGAPLVDTLSIVEALRADLLAEHPEWVDQAYHDILSATRSYDNPWGSPRSVKAKLAKDMGLPDASTQPAEVLLFVGCTMASVPGLAARACKAAALLSKAGVSAAALGRQEPCCGSVQKRIGAVEQAEQMRSRNISLLNGLGCRTIVTLCAGCANALARDYGAAAEPLQAEALHIVQYLVRLIKKGQLAFTKSRPPLTVAYHDPCHLGRHLGVFDPPREIIKALPGITLVERAATRQHTVCCGAGGGMRLFSAGSVAGQIGKEAVLAARDAGAAALVTACPFCEMNLEAAGKQLDPPLPVYDIVDLVAQALE